MKIIRLIVCGYIIVVSLWVAVSVVAAGAVPRGLVYLQTHPLTWPFFRPRGLPSGVNRKILVCESSSGDRRYVASRLFQEISGPHRRRVMLPRLLNWNLTDLDVEKYAKKFLTEWVCRGEGREVVGCKTDTAFVGLAWYNRQTTQQFWIGAKCTP